MDEYLMLPEGNNNNVGGMPDDELWDKVLSDPLVRQAVTRKDLGSFMDVYFTDRNHVAFAPYHEEMIALLQDSNEPLFVFEVFRGGGKTSLVTVGYGLWSVIGLPQKKNILIVSQTQEQAKLILANIKMKMMSEPLRSDMGPFSEGSDEWRSSTIVIKKYGARITIASIDGSIRGLLHGSKRPDTIFCDDLESLSSVQTLEARDKLYGFFTGDLLPAGDKNTRTIVLGTRLNEDSLIMRLQEDIERGRRAGIFRSYPLVDSVGNILWKAKFPDMAAVEAERLRIGNEDSWSREFLLRPLSKSSRVIWPEWIAYYDEYPDKDYIRGIFVGVDLAIGQNENNDFTSMVTILRCGLVDDMKIYVIPPVFNERVTYPEAIDQMRELAVKLRENKVYEPQFVIETNHFQEIYAATMINAGFTAISMKSTIPKRTRRSLVSKLFQERRVLFPREGAERLILQLTDLDKKHDDCADSLTIALLRILEHLGTDRSQETMEKQGLKWGGKYFPQQRSENK